MKIPSSLSTITSSKQARVIPYKLPSPVPVLSGSLALRDPSTADCPSILLSRQSYINPQTSKPLPSFQWKLPRGRTTTYGSIAAHLHTSPRAVGTALSKNAFCPKVPCHRVVAKDGGMGGFFGEKSTGLVVDQKIQLLKEEGVELVPGRVPGRWVVKRDASGMGEWLWA